VFLTHFLSNFRGVTCTNMYLMTHIETFCFFTLPTKFLATVIEDLGHHAARAGIGSLKGNSLGKK
jgi:hypothetical protein